MAQDTVAVLTCDGAGWHQPGGALIVPDNIVLLHLPPCSPELNPMENVWDYLRQNKLCALVWHSYDDIVGACRTAWTGSSPTRRALYQSEHANERVSAYRRIGIGDLCEVGAVGPDVRGFWSC